MPLLKNREQALLPTGRIGGGQASGLDHRDQVVILEQDLDVSSGSAHEPKVADNDRACKPLPAAA